MASYAASIQHLVRVFGNGAEEEVAIRLMEFLAGHLDTSHINLQLVRQLTPGADKGDLDKVIVRTLQFLAGDAAKVLDTKFEIIDSDDQPHALTDDEVKAVLFEHLDPLTGAKDPEIEKRLVIYFAPTQETVLGLSKQRSFPSGRA